jgi:hypothetical protein
VNSADSPAQPVFIEAPSHPKLQQLLAYWTAKRGARPAPARDDIRPKEIKALLPDVMIWNVEKVGGPYTIRLVGENIVRFVGRNNTGASATTGMPEEAAAMMTTVLTQVAQTLTPIFRAGKAFWHQDKSYREFEVCYLPLSTDGVSANMILGGLKFADDEPARALR